MGCAFACTLFWGTRAPVEWAPHLWTSFFRSLPGRQMRHSTTDPPPFFKEATLPEPQHFLATRWLYSYFESVWRFLRHSSIGCHLVFVRQPKATYFRYLIRQAVSQLAKSGGLIAAASRRSYSRRGFRIHLWKLWTYLFSWIFGSCLHHFS